MLVMVLLLPVDDVALLIAASNCRTGSAASQARCCCVIFALELLQHQKRGTLKGKRQWQVHARPDEHFKSSERL